MDHTSVWVKQNCHAFLLAAVVEFGFSSWELLWARHGQGEGTGDRAFILLLFPFLLNSLLRIIRKGPASGCWEQKSILGDTLRASCSRLFLCLATSNTQNVSIHVIETWVQKGSLRPNEVDMLCVCQGRCRVIPWTAPLSHMSLWKLNLCSYMQWNHQSTRLENPSCTLDRNVSEVGQQWKIT